jgi:hypothetical protein
LSESCTYRVSPSTERDADYPVGGVLQDYMRDLEQDPEDLIGQDEDDWSVDEGNLYFKWRQVATEREAI